jgi:hypothetical protein
MAETPEESLGRSGTAVTGSCEAASSGPVEQSGGTGQSPEVQSVPGGLDLHEKGAKADGGKPDTSLLQYFGPALLEVARVGTFGQDKYTRGGWLEVPEGHRRYTAAMLRHFFSEMTEGTYDQDPSCEEYGYKDQIRHDAQVAWNALARLTLALKEEQDD